MAKETSLGSTPKENVEILLIAYFRLVRITVESSYENETQNNDYENILTIVPVISYWVEDKTEINKQFSPKRKGRNAKGKAFSYCTHFLHHVELELEGDSLAIAYQDTRKRTATNVG